MLYQIVKYGSKADFAHRVISLGASSYYEELLRGEGAEVIVLPLRKRPLSSMARLVRLLRGTKLLCCWMYHANFLGYIAAKLAGVQKIIWCIRHSNLDKAVNKGTTLRINHLCARWSKGVDVITYNGVRARTIHEEIGYCTEKGVVLDNGCDTQEYAPDARCAEQLRTELGIPEEKMMILSVTKDSPIKDIPTFLEAFARLKKQCDMPVVAVICGAGVECGNERLRVHCEEDGLDLGRDIFLLGMRHDVPKLLAACDVYVLHSAGEAFPNVLLQAMSCGCLCVSTDVGDARRILNAGDYIVQPGNPDALAEKMKQMLDMDQQSAQTLRVQNRQRVCAEFSVEKIVKNYEELFSL